jgi:hypothetical protein
MKPRLKPILALLLLTFLCCEKGDNSDNTLDIKGKLANHSACKYGLQSDEGWTAIPDTLSCITYSYSKSTQLLTIMHLNAAFNCCPETLSCKISVVNDTIIIKESEASALCRCDCLYDLDVVIQDVPPKKFQIRIIEPYLGDQAPFLFEVDLNYEPDGSLCLVRKQYPWGVQ